ncbi:MAG: flagellar hook-associated protein FlgK, partial [Rhodothermales bacterium]
MSINQLIDITRRSFRSLNGAMNTVSQNIANVNTEGYSRRRVTLQADSLVSPGIITQTPPGTATGAGVSIGAYERMRDGLLAASTYDASTGLGSAQEEQRLLGALEGIFPIGDGSLSDQLNDFWDAWATLADHPTDNGVRMALRSHAQSLTTTFNRTDEALSLLEQGTEEVLVASVDEVNGLFNKIAELNNTVQSARFQGSPDLVAEDERDQLVKDLAALLPVRVQEDREIGYSVLVNGMTVVQGDHVVELNLDRSGGTPRIVYGDTQVEFNPPQGSDGKLGALLRMVTDTLPGTRSSLDTMANALVT